MLLFGIAWVVSLDKATLFTALGNDITIKDLILILGGVFLIGKATWEIHHKIEAAMAHGTPAADKPTGPVSFAGVITQIVLLDLVFSIDSVLTAVGMVNPNRRGTTRPSASVPPLEDHTIR